MKTKVTVQNIPAGASLSYDQILLQPGIYVPEECLDTRIVVIKAVGGKPNIPLYICQDGDVEEAAYWQAYTFVETDETLEIKIS